LSVSNISSNSFSFPLQNVFGHISVDELPFPRPVLEVVSPVAHVDVQPVEVVRSHQTSREVLENPAVNDATDSLLDGVEHNHVCPRELLESPKGAREHVIHSSSVEHDDMHELSAEFQEQLEAFVEREVELFGPLIKTAAVRDPPLVTLEVSNGSLDGNDE
jgi:hypothetical protein